MKEAMLYEKLDNAEVRCRLCAHYCRIPDGKRGRCGVRENRGGTLYSLVYNKMIAQNVDPVEKKPLYHFQPGSRSFSLATVGCNFRCRWCQNCEISQYPRYQQNLPGRECPPEKVIKLAQQYSCRNIAYTYTEPTVFFEYAYDTAGAAHEAGMKNIFVTNGFMTQEMLDTMNGLLDAANVDMKAFRDDVYKRYTGARLEPVLDSMRKMKSLGVWLEVTTLVIPGINDSVEEARDAARFIVDELGPEVPWHLSRFFPANEMNHVSPTPVSTLETFRDTGAQAGLKHIYIGNTGTENTTRCSHCGADVIVRGGMGVRAIRTDADGRCSQCGTPLAGVDIGG